MKKEIPKFRYETHGQCDVHEVQMTANSIMQRCSKCGVAIMNLVVWNGERK